MSIAILIGLLILLLVVLFSLYTGAKKDIANHSFDAASCAAAVILVYLAACLIKAADLWYTVMVASGG